MKKYFLQIKNILLDAIFPIHCLGCDMEGTWLCDDCYKKISIDGFFYCPVCHGASKYGLPCDNCKNKIYLDQHIAITTYKEKSLLGNLVHTLKYSYADDVLQVFEKIIKDFLHKNSNIFLDSQAITFVPLHKKRYVERGFNQAQALADILARNTGLEVLDLLQRNKNTQHQARLKREDRLKNVKNVFVSKKIEKNIPKKNNNCR